MHYYNLSKPASKAQKDTLTRMGVRFPDWISTAQADQLIRQHNNQWAGLPPTTRQEEALRNLGLWTPGMGRGAAAKAIEAYLAKAGKAPPWQPPV